MIELLALIHFKILVFSVLTFFSEIQITTSVSSISDNLFCDLFQCQIFNFAH